MSLTQDTLTRGKTDPRLNSVGELLDGMQGDAGLPGLFKTVYRMIGQNQPSIDCFRQAENDFGSAANVEDEEHLMSDQVWGAALGFAGCLRDALINPEEPEVPPPPPPDPDPLPPGVHRLSDVVLAALLVRLSAEGQGRRA